MVTWMLLVFTQVCGGFPKEFVAVTERFDTPSWEISIIGVVAPVDHK